MKLNFSLYTHYCKIKTLIYKEYFVQWWLQRESNQRHTDFQSVALPTELWSQMAVLMGLEPTVYCVTGSRDNHYTTEPFGCGNRIWTYNLWVMSPTSYRIALSRDIKFKHGGGKGIRTPAPSPTSWFSRPVPSTRLGYSSSYIWCLRPDLNRHVGLTTQDFKSCASTYSATQAKKMVSRWRFELQTLWLKVKCSTDWASGT